MRSSVRHKARLEDGKCALSAIDLFAGCGGLTSGLRAAGFEVLAAVEKDVDAARTYKANHPRVQLIRDDIRRVSPKSLLRSLGLSKGQTVGLIAGCPPCQGFTRLTEYKRRPDRRNGLVRQFLRFVLAIRPQTCMLENVPGLVRSAKGRRYFNELRRGLKKAGYHVTYAVVELADYGVPQLRKRLVLIGARSSPIPIPSPTHRDPSLAAEPGRRRWRSVRTAIGKLPVPPLRSKVLAKKAVPRYTWHYARDVTAMVRERLVYVRLHGGGRAALPARLRLKCHDRRPDGYHDVYGVIDWDAPAPTITSGCTNASKGRFGHPAYPRPLTATEAALLQTFPRTYQFEGAGLDSVAAQIGNALPRRFAKVIGVAIAKTLRDAS